MSSRTLQHIREAFFNAAFSLLGHMANCDGYINREEIKRTRLYMEKMKLSDHCRRKAAQLFKAGASPIFDMTEVLDELREAARNNPSIIEVLLIYLISLARTDGLLVKKEIAVVREVAENLGYSSILFDHFLKMIAAQDRFEPHSAQQGSAKQDSAKKDSAFGSQHEKTQQRDQSSQKKSYQNKSQQENSRTGARQHPDLTAAYEALAVAPGANAMEIKKAYRKLVNQFHPDKLQGQGLPPDFISAATERFKKIQAAYDYLKKYQQ